MGYTSIASLKEKKAEDLYEEECRLRGCTIDRCQLYLYRALEYFVHTENPDREKCNGGIGKMIILSLSVWSKVCGLCVIPKGMQRMQKDKRQGVLASVYRRYGMSHLEML